MDLLCPWGPSSYVFFSSDPGVPHLLYYAYIPIIFLSLLFSIFVLIKDMGSLRSRLIFLISIFFTCHTLNTIFEWVSNDPFAQMYSWQLTAFFELPISLLLVYFTYVFINNSESKKLKLFLSALFIPVLLLLPTNLNIAEFYLTDYDCGGVLGVLWYYIYAIEILSILVVAYIGFSKYLKIKKDKNLSNQTLIFTVGSVLFIGMFNVANIFGELTKTYEINLIGPVGLLLLIVLLSYLIVKFGIFNAKLLATQALVWGLVILISSQFLFVQNSVNTILISITLIVSSTLGLIIIRSVKKEISLREQLEIANKGQTNLIHIMNHQIKGYLSVDKNIFAELMTDDYGKIPKSAMEIIKKGFESADTGIQYVTSILRGASAENGTLTYSMSETDFMDIVLKQLEKLKPVIKNKNLNLIVDLENKDYKIIGDQFQLSEAVKNLIENSINYTLRGSITVGLVEKEKKIVFYVRDTGIGIKPEDRSRIFRPGGILRDSLKVNVNSSGYGLAFVKGVAEKHGGKVWFDSDGEDQGSVFYLEIPKKIVR